MFLDGWLVVAIQEAVGLKGQDLSGYSDPYVTVNLGKQRPIRTKTVYQTCNPVWNENYELPVLQDVDAVVFCVKNRNKLSFNSKLGWLVVPSEALMAGPVEGWFELQPDSTFGDCAPVACSEPPQDGGKKGYVRVRVEFQDHVGGYNVPRVYFPMVEHSNVRLYQDAHVPEGITGLLPTIMTSTGPYKHGQAWVDLYRTLKAARHFIYITGWSVWINTVLVRGEGPEETVGELLKAKSGQGREGVKVCLLLWNEKLSNNNTLVQTDGLMVTHDEETRLFFQGAENITCKLAARYGDTNMIQYLYSHHQKSVICDAEYRLNPRLRRVVAFVGGLDICDGRYDTPDHPLYKTLQGVHANDFHNVWPVTQEYGPREPWHDVHSKVEGPIARQVLQNFIDRWEKQAWKYRDALADLSAVPLASPEQEAAAFAHNKEQWAAQLFRSIDHYSTTFHKEYAKKFKKELAVDRGILQAYLHHIRSAERFIYIENQYFMGSCLDWHTNRDSGCDHLIPRAIANQICSKIAAGQQFAVYVVVPIHPEGVPETAAVQEILHWQYRTIEMMYDHVADAIREAGISAHPKDYLNFYCLGARETSAMSQATATVPPLEGSVQEQLEKSRRYMLYVHSKMMIVDDAYIMVGSANINQRSMDGARDSEICVGAYQVNHVPVNGTTPKGQVYGFRNALWAEHMGLRADDTIPECWADPGSLECVRYVNSKAQTNWQVYTGEEVRDMNGHLMTYPLKVSEHGHVDPLDDWPCFPDTNASVKGVTSSILIDALTS